MTQELPEGTVTVLFTDVVGSTELTNRLGDEAARVVLGACDELVRRQLERHRGQEVKGTGDGLMVAFTSARRAIACAVDIQRAMAERARTEPDRAVGVKIGLNTGEVIKEEQDLFGATVNAAERIAGHAKAGEILLSEGTRLVLGAATTVELEDRGEVELRGFPEPYRLYAVSWNEEAAAVTVAGRTSYVGRQEERAQLRRWLDEATQGRGSLVMVGGEPGIGKTRLSQKLGQEAAERGVATLTGHCYEMEGSPPYIPFVEILESAARAFPLELLREALGDAAPEVAKLMPELRRMFPDIPPAAELPPEQERRYLYNSVLDFVERASRAQPLLLVLEDLHWGDDSTLLLLQHIAQQLGGMPVLVVGTYRDVELDVARPLAKALEELLRQRLAHDVTLRRLPESDVEAMLRARSGREPPSRLVEVIYRETEGNPFFVEEVFKHLAEAGKLFDEEGRWRPDLEIGEEEVPRGVRLVIGRRLERVSEECRRVLTAAAIVGRAFSYELLQELVDIGEDALLDAVDEAGRAQLVSSAAAGGEARFTFAHEQIRQTLLSTLQLPRRQRLHLRVAEAIEGVSSASQEEAASDLAHHFYQAGNAADTEKTVRYMSLAGDQAMATAAFEDALRLFETALSLADPDDKRRRADLLRQRGLALRSIGRWEDALQDWKDSLAEYERLADAEAVGRLSYLAAWQSIWAGDAEEERTFALRGLAALGDRVSLDRCRLLAMAAQGTAWSQRDYGAADAMFDEADQMAESLGDPDALGHVLGIRGDAYFASGNRIREVTEASLRGAELLRSTGALYEMATALHNAQVGLLLLGRVQEAEAIEVDLLPLAERLGNHDARHIAVSNASFRELLVAGPAPSDPRLEELIEFALRVRRPFVSTTYAQLGWTSFLCGRWQEAEERFRKGVELVDPFLGFVLWGSLMRFLAYAGQRDAALDLVNRHRSGDIYAFPQPGRLNFFGSWPLLSATIETLAVLGRTGEAAELYPLFLEGAETSGAAIALWCTGSLTQTVAGIAAACGRQWERAEEHYQTALGQAHELPHKTEQPEVRRWYARMLIDRDGAGDRDKARELLTEAIAMYTKIGMPKHVEMAEAMLGEV